MPSNEVKDSLGRIITGKKGEVMLARRTAAGRFYIGERMPVRMRATV